jgi:alginate O-acetyltransferase complex protein AlgI
VTGLWHGAAWTFVLWGALHGTFLLVERLAGIGGAADDTRSDPLGQARTIVLVLFAWILFRSSDLDYALGFMAALFQPSLDLPATAARALDPLAALAIGIGCATVLLPRDWVTGVRLEQIGAARLRFLRLAAVGIVFPAAIVFLIAGDFSPFLYFQF